MSLRTSSLRFMFAAEIRMRTRLLLPVLALLLSVVAFAAEPKADTIGAFTGTAPEVVKSAISDHGYRVTLPDGKIAAEVWPAKSVEAGQNNSESALYPMLQNGVFAGVVNFPTGATDFRGQKIAAGVYTLRYQLLPTDGNHMGVAPNPDFFLLIPVMSDTNIAARLPYMGIVSLSRKASGTNHPGVFALADASSKVPDATVEENHTILTLSLSIGGKQVPVGMIVVGTAE